MPPQQTPSRPDARPYLSIPVDLLIAFRDRPTAIGIYAGVTRLNMIYKRAVAISRADLALWEGTTTRSGTIQRAVADMADAGWLIRQAEPGQKLHILGTWGRGRTHKPRQFHFNRPDRGRPANLRTVALPTDLFDHYLGRIIPDHEGSATIERYIDAPLLSFADIGALALAQFTPSPATTALRRLGLATDYSGEDITIPPLLYLLQRVADGALAPVQLTTSGSAQLRRLQAAADAQAQGGPHDDHGGGPHGGPHLNSGYSASQCTEKPVEGVARTAWDTWDHDQSKHDLPSHDLHATDSTSFLHNEEHPEDLRSEPDTTEQSTTTPQPDQHSGAREENHSVLDPLLMGWHRALNPARAISAAEWFALLDLQERYGVDALRAWMFRATNAGRTEVSPRYYEVCAASDACAGLSGREPRRPAPTRPAPDPYPEPVPAPPARPAPAPLPQLDTAHAQAVRDLAEATGQPIRCPHKLAEVPLDLLSSWRSIAEHPGLLAKWRMGWVVAELAKGSKPPTVAELNRWAEEKGIHWADPRMAPWVGRGEWDLLAQQERRSWAQPGADMAEVPIGAQEGAGKAWEPYARFDLPAVACELPEVAAPPAPPAPPAPTHSLAGLWDQVLADLRHTTGRAVFRDVLACTRLVRLDDTEAVVAVPSVAVMQAVDRQFTRPLREALSGQVGAVTLRMVIKTT